MKRVLTFMMLLITIVMAASNQAPERISYPDVDVGYIVDTNNDITAEATISENVMFIMNTTGNRQEGVAETTIRSGPMTSEMFIYKYKNSTNNQVTRGNDRTTICILMWQRCDVSYVNLSNNIKNKPAIVFRV